MPTLPSESCTLDAALDAAIRVRRLLEESLKALDDERALIRILDADGLIKSAASRAASRDQIAQAAADYEKHVVVAVHEVGNAPATIDLGALAAIAPLAVAKVRSVLEEVTALARQVRAEEEIQQALLSKAKAIVSGYLQAISPRTIAYTARGQMAVAPTLSAMRSRRA